MELWIFFFFFCPFLSQEIIL
uniref:Uncharacterized protein n=1 Tax=Rhizophora mucronata TaxID=61149 RepID=A0A2P2Q2H8_RHIMU